MPGVKKVQRELFMYIGWQGEGFFFDKAKESEERRKIKLNLRILQMKEEGSNMFDKLLFNSEYGWRESLSMSETSQNGKGALRILRWPTSIRLELARVCTQQSKFSSWSVIKMTAVTICMKGLFRLPNWKEKQAANTPIIITSNYIGLWNVFFPVRKFTLSCPKRTIVVCRGYPLDLWSLNYMHNA